MPRAKYIGVIEDLKTKIASGKLAPGDRIVSIREMCDAYDVSSIVALRVFRELSDQGLIEKRDGEGYYVLPEDGDNHADKIVCAFRPLRDMSLTDNFGNRIIFGIMESALSNHKHVVFPESCMRLRNRIPTDEDVKILADEVFSIPGIAGIVLDMRIPDESIRRHILPRAGRIPVVVAGRSAKAPVKASFFPMEEIGADVAKLARRSSAAVFLLFPASEATFSDIRLLEHAFLKTLDADPAAVFTTREFTTVSREKDREVAKIAAKHIAAARGKAFVFCGADSMAGYFYDLMKEHGLTAPQDYILMGFGGFELSEVHTPKLATVALDQAAIGRNAVELALGGSMENSIAAPYAVKFNETF